MSGKGIAMKKQFLALFTAACLLLTGCSSLLSRKYSTVTEHSSKYWESESEDTLRAESYQDVVNDLLLLIGRHAEDASLRLYGFEDSGTVSSTLEKAATEVQQETPMGAYAVKYITSSNRAQRGYYEASIHVKYRRTAEQVQNVVNATSTSALQDLLDTALKEGKTELAVRIGYWSSSSMTTVRKIVLNTRKRWKLMETKEWAVSCYPSDKNVGMIEFQFS